jgi:ribonuclease D
MLEPPEQLIVEPAQLVDCCAHLEAARRFGLDTEFVGEDNYHPQLCLIQIATSETLFLIDPFTVGPLDALWKVVVNPANEVIVHAGREEVRLCRRWCGQTPANLFDLQIAAGLVGLGYPLGHGPLVKEVLGVYLAKGETLTEWRHRPLTTSQIRYALDDVRYLLPVWQHLSEALAKLGRGDWAREEFARLTLQAMAEAPALESEKWRKLRGSGSLDRRGLARLRELFHWREQTALQANRPPRTIVRDDLLVEIARRNPTRDRDLQVVRGLARRHIPAIVEASERARALPAEELPRAPDREQDPPQVGLAVSILNAVLADFAARNHLAGNLIATTSDLKLLVRSRLQGNAPPQDIFLTQGWRGVHVLPELQKILEGRRSVRIRDLHADAPFAYRDEEGEEP